MMRLFYSAAAFSLAFQVFLAMPAFPQDTLKQYFARAERLFDDGRYEDALPFYARLTDLIPDTLYFKYRLGICHLYKGDSHEKSIELFLEILRKRPFSADLNFYLGRAYHVNYQFDKAVFYFNLALKEPQLSEEKRREISKYITYCNNGKEQLSRASYVEITNLGGPVNTDNNEYAPVITADENTIIFTYRGEKSIGGLQEDEFRDDILLSTKKDGVNWSKPTTISAAINTPDNESAIALSTDGFQLFLYKFNQIDQGDIYYSFLKGKRWLPPVKVTGQVNTEFWEGSCSLSPDGKTLFFASKRVGGYGGKDIYKASFLPDSTWGNVENMGPEINTEWDEDGPFIYPSGTILFFVSNGTKSIGGMDIMQSNMKMPGVWSEPMNLGYPVNTVDDDIYYVISAAGNGFFSSSRKGGHGRQDIYMVKGGVIGEKPAMMVVRGTAGIGATPVASDISVYSENKHEEVAFHKSNSETGKFLVTLPPGDKYTVTFQLSGYKDEVRTYSTLGLETYKFITENISFSSIKLNRIDELYRIAVARGDSAFKAGDYVNAIVFYSEALGYKPGEKYPKDQIEECRRRLIASEKIVIRESVKNFVPGEGEYFTIQIGAFSNKFKADSAARYFQQKKYETYIQYVTFIDVNENWYRVRIGSYKTLDAAKEFAPALLREKLPEGRVWIDMHRIDGMKTEKMTYKVLQVVGK